MLVMAKDFAETKYAFLYLPRQYICRSDRFQGTYVYIYLWKIVLLLENK